MRPGKQGLGRAYVDGMTRAMLAGAQFVVQMDSDLSHAPGYLPQMLGVLLSTDARAHRPQRADAWSTGLDRPTTSAPHHGK